MPQTTTTGISQMKTDVMNMMVAKYGTTAIPSVAATDQQIEQAFFMRAQDAKAIRDCCKKNAFKISFRAAGENTIPRIQNGNPCKGHTILDKSIKMKGSAWTYTADQSVLNKLKGLVGFVQSSNNNSSNNLGGVWAWENGKEVKVPLAGVKADDAAFVKTCFTGDYDMHDLLKKDQRILAATPDEASAIEAINNALLAADANRKQSVTTTTPTGHRNFESPYALIRHGAQTSFMSFLLSGKGLNELAVPNTAPAKIPSEDAVMNIDGSIVMFDEQGNAYILDSVEKVYWYYKTHNLLDQIPYYYFFQDLRKNNNNNSYDATKSSAQLSTFASEINDMLTTFKNH